MQKIAIEVVEKIKERIGDEEFTKRIAECSKLFATRLEERKRKQKVDELWNSLLFATEIDNIVCPLRFIRLSFSINIAGRSRFGPSKCGTEENSKKQAEGKKKEQLNEYNRS